jgi:hypothetical protein
MKIEMIGMSTYPQPYFHINLLTKLEPIIPHFSWCMDYIHYYLQSTCYHLNLVKIEIHNTLEF